MYLTILGSSSKGNCYLLRSSVTDETLIIEAGIRMQDVKQALGWSLSGVVGCLVTHRHKDHAKYIGDFMSCGIRVLSISDVLDSVKDNKFSHFGKLVAPMHGYIVGGFRIYVLPVCHDVPCVGFIIDHAEMGKLLFLTDTMMFEYLLPKGIRTIMIEANYADDILQRNIDNGMVLPSMRERLLGSHMELNTTKEILRANDLTDVQNVILLHLSDRNSDSGRFRQEVADCCHRTVSVADKRLTHLQLGYDPY
jgi:phosphoribosyl 1,2-cyclic phosphodiesterase